MPAITYKENPVTKLDKKHQPIMIEPEGLDCAYVVRDFDAESDR